jgi:thiol-disulfide isomerase/thioredoxin
MAVPSIPGLLHKPPVTPVNYAPATRWRFSCLGRGIAALLVAAAPLAASAQTALQTWTGAPKPPPIELNALGGQRLALSDLSGKVVVVNFWATWCEPCVEEMSSMQRLRDRLGAEHFEIFAVNFQEGEPRIRSFLNKVPLTFPIVRDTDGSVARAWKVRIFPSSFVVDRDGAIRYVLVGSIDWASAEVEKTLRPLLPPPRAATTPR